MSASGDPAAVTVPAGPRHGLRIFLIWLVASAIAAPVVYFVWGPHLPPGAMSSSAANQQFDNAVLATVATPVFLGVWIYFGYALTFWRRRAGDQEDGPPELPARCGCRRAGSSSPRSSCWRSSASAPMS